MKAKSTRRPKSSFHGVLVALVTGFFGGGFEEAGDLFLKKVVETVKEWSFREATDNLTVMYSHLRENAVALGAASLVTQKMFAQLW